MHLRHGLTPIRRRHAHGDIRVTVGLLALFSTIMYFGFGFLANIATQF